MINKTICQIGPMINIFYDNILQTEYSTYNFSNVTFIFLEIYIFYP